MTNTIIKNMQPAIFKNIAKAITQSHIAENNSCSITNFKQRLSLEKRRAERLNSTFSIVIFGLNNFLDNKIKNEQEPGISTVYLTNFFKYRIRETDGMCLSKDHRILFLLPDTNNMGAQCFCERMIKLLSTLQFESFEQRNFDAKAIGLKIISYPEKTAAHKEEKITSGRENRSRSETLTSSNFHRNYLDELNMCVSTLNGTAMAIPFIDVFFWDRQLLENIVSSIQEKLKRLMDIFGAIFGLVLFSPILLLTALLVKLSSPGPVLFKQRRQGYKGNFFTFLKFRTMFCDSKEDIHENYVKTLIEGNNDATNKGSSEQPFYKLVSDPRVTPVGRFLRKTSLDELPQFWNVLVGEMSLVGPRPPIPYEVKHYQDWHYRRIFEVKPGITGLWQVSGRNKTTFDEMVRLDIGYAKKWSLLLDIKIMLQTIKVMVLSEGR